MILKRGTNNIENYDAADYERMDYLFEEWIPSHREVWLFGAGAYANAWRHYMSECGVNINGFVVTAPKQTVAETGESIISIDEFKFRYRNGKIGLVLTMDSDCYEGVLPKLLFAFDDLLFLKERYKFLAYKRRYNFTASDKMFSFCSMIVSNCNLSCYSCCAASPLVEGEHYYSLKSFTNDLLLVKRVIGEKFSSVWISGGEPIMHPQLLDLLQIARNVLGKTHNTINLITNGILLHKQSDEFWKCCRDKG